MIDLLPHDSKSSRLKSGSCNPFLRVACLLTIFVGSSSHLPSTIRADDTTALGECVNPLDDVRTRMGVHEEVRLWTQETLDLNGDGIDDLVIADPGYCGSGGCNPWWIYVRNGECGYFVGTATGRELFELETHSNGWIDVGIESHAGFCPYSEYELHFDGRQYTVTRQRWCDCDYNSETLVSCNPWENALLEDPLPPPQDENTP